MIKAKKSRVIVAGEMETVSRCGWSRRRKSRVPVEAEGVKRSFRFRREGPRVEAKAV